MEREQTNIYPYPYAVREGCLCMETASNGYRKLCTFAPRMLSEIAMDDGQEVTRYYSIGGTDEQGRKPEPEKKPNMMPATILLVAMLGGGGFVLYKKMMGKKKEKEQAKPDPDADYVDDEEDYGYVESEEYSDYDYSGEEDTDEPV